MQSSSELLIQSGFVPLQVSPLASHGNLNTIIVGDDGDAGQLLVRLLAVSEAIRGEIAVLVTPAAPELLREVLAVGGTQASAREDSVLNPLAALKDKEAFDWQTENLGRWLAMLHGRFDGELHRSRVSRMLEVALISARSKRRGVLGIEHVVGELSRTGDEAASVAAAIANSVRDIWPDVLNGAGQRCLEEGTCKVLSLETLLAAGSDGSCLAGLAGTAAFSVLVRSYAAQREHAKLVAIEDAERTVEALTVDFVEMLVRAGRMYGMGLIAATGVDPILASGITPMGAMFEHASTRVFAPAKAESIHRMASEGRISDATAEAWSEATWMSSGILRVLWQQDGENQLIDVAAGSLQRCLLGWSAADNANYSQRRAGGRSVRESLAETVATHVASLRA